MAKNNNKKSYNGYNYSDGAKFESCYDGKYTTPNGPSEPAEVSFNEMYFGQTEGIRGTISYKAPVDVAWTQPKPQPEPGPKPEPKMYIVKTEYKPDRVIEMKPTEGEYEEGTILTIKDIKCADEFHLEHLYISIGEGEKVEITSDYEAAGKIYNFTVTDKTTITVDAVH